MSYIRTRAIENHRTPVPAHAIAHQLMPLARHLRAQGQGPHALITAQQELNRHYVAKQPTQVFFPPPPQELNRMAGKRSRRY